MMMHHRASGTPTRAARRSSASGSGRAFSPSLELGGAGGVGTLQRPPPQQPPPSPPPPAAPL
jgi:hypothetical protein